MRRSKSTVPGCAWRPWRAPCAACEDRSTSVSTPRPFTEATGDAGGALPQRAGAVRITNSEVVRGVPTRIRLSETAGAGLPTGRNGARTTLNGTTRVLRQPGRRESTLRRSTVDRLTLEARCPQRAGAVRITNSEVVRGVPTRIRFSGHAGSPLPGSSLDGMPVANLPQASPSNSIFHKARRLRVDLALDLLCARADGAACAGTGISDSSASPARPGATLLHSV
jgi:hypothetical protein